MSDKQIREIEESQIFCNNFDDYVNSEEEVDQIIEELKA